MKVSLNWVKQFTDIDPLASVVVDELVAKTIQQIDAKTAGALK